MIKNLFILSILFTVSLSSVAQKTFFNRVGEQTTESNCYYYRVSKGASKYASFYNSNGNKFFTGSILNAVSSSEEGNIYVGKCTWYYKNGNTKKEVNYNTSGDLEGVYREYYENGKLSEEAKYKAGKMVDNKKLEFDENGTSNVVFRDNFDNNSNDWDLYTSEKGSANLVNGELILEALTEDGISRYIPFYSESKAYSIELKLNLSDVKKGLKTGLIFGFKDWNNYNFYLISKNAFYVGTVYEGIVSMKMDGMYTYDIKQDGNNILKILTENGKSVYSINAVIQFKGDALPLKGSNLGVAVSGKNKVKADHLIFKELKSSFGSAMGQSDEHFSATGSGFIFDKKGYALTNHHVIEDASEIVVEMTINGEVTKFDAELVRSDETNDVAIIKILNFPVMNISYGFKKSGSESMGAEIFTLGYPLALNGMGKSVKFVDGKVSSKTGYQGAINSYQTSIPVQPGNSGGPVFNQLGEVIGIVNAKVSGADNVSYAIKINYAKNLIDLLPEGGSYPSNTKKLSTAGLQQKIKTLSNYVILIKTK